MLKLKKKPLPSEWIHILDLKSERNHINTAPRRWRHSSTSQVVWCAGERKGTHNKHHFSTYDAKAPEFSEIMTHILWSKICCIRIFFCCLLRWNGVNPNQQLDKNLLSYQRYSYEISFSFVKSTIISVNKLYDKQMFIHHLLTHFFSTIGHLMLYIPGVLFDFRLWILLTIAIQNINFICVVYFCLRAALTSVSLLDNFLFFFLWMMIDFCDNIALQYRKYF